MSWGDRYGIGYNRLCAIAHNRTLSTCCCCMVNFSEEIHHVTYGNDIVGWSIFPVCRKCHSSICHSKKNWIIDEDNPKWNNHNKDEFISNLRNNYFKIIKQ